MNDYSTLLAFMHPRAVEGDIVEIGAFVGKGTRQLCESFPDRTIHAVDVFDPEYDITANQGGILMSQFYLDELAGRNQWLVFCENTQGLQNLRTYQTDSTKFKPPKQVFLTIIDGGHSPEVLAKDFRKAKNSAYIAFHDYKHDLPKVTKTIDEITEGMERYEIGGTFLVCEWKS